MNRKLRALAVGVLLTASIGIGGAAYAVTTLPTPMVINATVLKVCVAGIGTPILMSSITQTTGLSGTGTVVVTCTPNTGYDILLDQGANAANGSAPNQRKLKALLSAATLTYGLYQDAAYSIPWGATTGTNTLHKTATGLADTSTVYMKVDSAAASAATAGDYADTVQVSVEY